MIEIDDKMKEFLLRLDAAILMAQKKISVKSNVSGKHATL